MRRSAAVLAVVVLLGAPPGLRSQATDPTFERIAAVVTEKMKEYQVPGVSIGIIRDGVVSTRGFGVTSVDHSLPVTDSTLFQVGSITKTFTGTVLMKLVEQGRVRLDAPVRTYLPDFAVRDAAASRDATVMDLLTHMGGWEGDVFEDTGSGADAVATYVTQLRGVEQVAPLRTVWSYNNSGFVVAGRIIEVVTGKSYEAAVEEMVTAPLGMRNTYITPGDVMTMRFAVGHNSSPKGPQVARPWPIGRYAHPAGGIISTVRDLLTYAQFHMGVSNAPAMFSADTLRRMHETVLTKQGSDEEMAVTWHVTKGGGVRRVGHGGATVGQQALLTFVPERTFAIALLTNATSGARLNQDVARAAMKEYFDIEDRDPTPSSTQPDLAPYAARYSRTYADVVVTAENGTLLVQTIIKRGFPNARAPVPPAGPKVPYAFYATDRAVGTTGPQKGTRIDFIRAPDGSIGWIRVSGRIHRKAGATS
jgi:CubicO group peptidase (beta-lactamase class C family)